MSAEFDKKIWKPNLSFFSMPDRRRGLCPHKPRTDHSWFVGTRTRAGSFDLSPMTPWFISIDAVVCVLTNHFRIPDLAGSWGHEPGRLGRIVPSLRDCGPSLRDVKPGTFARLYRPTNGTFQDTSGFTQYHERARTTQRYQHVR